MSQYEDLEALPINDANTGLSNFSPYQGLNYTRFSVAGNSSNKLILYFLSQLSASPVGKLLQALAGLLGPLVDLPPPLPQPSIVGATDKTTFRLNKFDFICGVRNQGASNVVNAGAIDYPCYIVIRPVEPGKKHMSFNCSFMGGSGFETCHVDLPPGEGFSMLTFGNASATALAAVGARLGLERFLNPGIEYVLASIFDNIHYTQYCSD